jgi:hypothetical protein
MLGASHPSTLERGSRDTMFGASHPSPFGEGQGVRSGSEACRSLAFFIP